MTSGNPDAVGPAPEGRGSGSQRRSLPWLARRVHGLAAATGIFLLSGLFASLLGVAAFSALTDEVLDGETARFDRAVLLWLQERATPLLDGIAGNVTALGDTLVVVVLAIVAGSLLWLLGRTGYAALLFVSVGGASIISPVLKSVFDRPRPRLVDVGAAYAEASPAYPSGHATLSMVTFMVIAFIVHRLSETRTTGVVALCLAGVAVVLIGLSRLYLGVHYPSDVLAGYIAGLAWAVLCAWFLAGWQATRAKKHQRFTAPESTAENSA